MLYNFEIADENIFFVDSSCAALTKNTQILADKIYWTTTKS